MSTKPEKTFEELAVPPLPDPINNSAVKTAATGVQNAKNALNSMTYDNFKSGSMYSDLKKSYTQQGQQAMKDTLGQVAARTGGMASSYATSAANQSYNNYMQTLEDAARAMYAEEYSRAQDRYGMAQQEYANAYGEYRDSVGDAWTRYNAERGAYESDRNYNYQVGRDALEDQKTDLYNLVASGGTPDKNDYPDLSVAEYNNIVATATGNRTDDNRLNVDKEFESIFGAEDFDWDSFDWDGDGDIDTDDSPSDYDWSTSSYGEEYWEQYSKDAQQGYADADTKEAQGRVSDAWNMGQNPSEQDLKDAGYMDENGKWTTDGTVANARRASGTCIGIWENGGVPSNDDLKAAGYMDENDELTPLGEQAFDSYFKPQISQSEAMNNMLNTGILNTQGQAAFDYYFGSGAYTAITNFAKDKEGNKLDLSTWSEETYTDLGDAAKKFLSTNPWAEDLILAMLTEYETKKPRDPINPSPKRFQMK